MRSSAVNLAIIIFSQFALGQTASAASSSSGGGATAAPATKRVGNVDVPAEKTRPIVVPKFADAITIDGKADEPA